MARSILPLRRSILSKSQSFLQYFQIQSQTQNPISCLPHFLSKQPSIQPHTRSFGTNASVMRKSAFENKLFRLLRNEVQLILDESPLDKPPSDFEGFKVTERPGDKWITLTKIFGESEEINIAVSMFDGSVPIPTEGDKPGESAEEEEEEHLHLTMMISIFKEGYNRVLGFVCSAWPDNLDIQRLFVREKSEMQLPNNPYTGPIVQAMDNELQDSLYDFLGERGIDDNLCVFVHRYIHYKHKAEYIRWMESTKKVLEKK
ncbi:uncharacterized protein At2g39795, mitochondrial-like [Silene latifolia]|uniref:uncharacterized protein At2g39795, mitochondrial-like n=1 Tax=Silene latifolia TaxID=37657 RepID=UPI003D76BD36